VCMCACMCVYMCACMCACVHACVCTCVRAQHKKRPSAVPSEKLFSSAL
jgi:hypothetical protein